MAECSVAFRYRSRERVKGPLFRVVLDHLEEFAMRLAGPSPASPHPHPGVVERFRKYIECGLPRFGVVRLRCPKCGEDVFAAFSCKIRGLCPSCDAKRATVTMANAVDRLLPEAGYRQWVLTLPKRLRFLTNLHPALIGDVAVILARALELFMRRKYGAGAPAHIAFVQRFGGEMNLHPHIHSIVSEGLFFKERGLFGPELGFKITAPPAESEIADLTESIRRKVIHRFKRLGYLLPLDAQRMLSWPNPGFSLHAKVYVPPGDRDGLQRVLYYCGRPALSVQRVSYYAQRNLVVYRTDPRGLRPNESHLLGPGNQLLRAGSLLLDVLGAIDFGGGYAELLPGSEVLDVGGYAVRVLTLEKLAQIKRHLSRPKDKLMLMHLEAALEEREKARGLG